MDTVTLTRDGRLLSGQPEHHAGDIREHRQEASDILPCLGSRVQLEEGFTLRSFFTLTERYPDLRRMSQFLIAAASEANNCPSNGCTTPDFTELVFAKTVELTGAPGEPVMNVFTTFRGMLPDEGMAPRSGEIRFHSLNMLLDMPIRLGRLRHVVFGDRTSMLECDTTFSLFEIIEGIAWELGFQGGSQQCSLRR
ncbi:hypothetical protein N1030_04960 [Desulfovibrio mangrovi]|uniref:hypothetical protein n=1 Tax=Desulfovibrio mangrovi TaxID=2976983 RepID=UPI002246CB0F|nr:hypothetical protein [Desulfovibrio mangrovi]UZP68332.1 hypothetical protein N1030_04960 [Desulfovibrio mangrovi]